MGLWVFKALVCLECWRERKSGNRKGSDYAGPLGYITNLGLDSKSKDKPGKTFTQEYDTIKLCFLKEKKKLLWCSLENGFQEDPGGCEDLLGGQKELST